MSTLIAAATVAATQPAALHPIIARNTPSRTGMAQMSEASGHGCFQGYDRQP